jgi:outer membrane protein insertion porin family
MQPATTKPALDRRSHTISARLLVAAVVLLCALLCAAIASAQPASDDTPPPPPASDGAPPLEGGPVGDPSADAEDGDPAAEGEEGTAQTTEKELDPNDVQLPRIPSDDLDAAEGLTVARIDITGNRRIAATDVSSYLRTKVGEPLRKEVLRRDVRELWRSGFFDDIEIDLKRSEDDVRLRLHVRERPAIAAVEFEGNQKIKDDDLSEAIEVKPETILSRPALRRAIQKIRDMYAEQGYFLAEATTEVKKERNNEVTVRFNIQEHSQVSVKRVTFIGNEEISTEELRAVMFTGNPGIMAFGSGGPFRQDAFERDIAMVSAMYYDRGYLQVGVHTPRVMLTPDKSGIEVSVTIDEGPRFKIRQLRVYEQGPDGNEVEPLGGRRALRMMVRAESGDYFNRAQLLEDLAVIRSMYRDEGYANVIAEPQTAIDPKTNEVDLIIPVIRGPVVYFERIEIRGNTKTRDRVIRRQFEIHEAEKFSETGINRTRRRVTALGYFERVDVSTEQGSADDRLIVYVDVSEKPTGTFQVGAGFSSIENFIATAQVQQANMMGNGQSLGLQVQWSGIRRTADLSFTEPYFLGSDFSLTAQLFDQLRFLSQFSQRSRGGAITFGYPLIEPEVNVSLTYNLTLDEVSTGGGPTFLGGGGALGGANNVQFNAFSQLPLANLFNDGITSSLRPGISYDTRDNRLFPTSGVFLSASTEWAMAALGSQNRFVRNRWTGRFYLPLYKTLVLKLNTNAGMVTSPTDEGVPIFARFFLGGILDLRGYQFRTVGPRMPLTRATDPNSPPIPNGENIGGNLMYYQNLELEIPIFEEVGLKAVLFTDLGNAWNLEGNYCDAAGGSNVYRAISPCFAASDLLNMRTSWGFGFRWHSPMGPLRFEWGFPFKPLPYEQPMVFQFTIGNFF